MLLLLRPEQTVLARVRVETCYGQMRLPPDDVARRFTPATKLFDVDVGQVDDINGAGVVTRGRRIIDRAHLQRTTRDADRSFERAPLADDQWARVLVHMRVGQGLSDDLRPDAARIAHR